MELDVFTFLTSVTIACAGAFSLWGWLFAVKARRSENPAWDQLVHASFVPVFWSIWFLILVFALGLMARPLVALAFEGVKAIPDLTIAEMNTAAMPVMLMLCVLALGGVWLLFKKERTLYQLEWFYFLTAVLVSIFAFAPVFVSFDATGWFYAIHRVLPMLTLGTVMVTLWLFWKMRSQLQVLPRLLPTLLLFMFGGIAIEFVKTISIVNSSLVLDDQFFFSQLVLALIIIVSVLCIRPWTRQYRNRSDRGVQEQESVALAVVPLSFLTLFAVDASTTFSCPFQLAGVMYLGLVAVLWLMIRAMKRRYGN